MRRRARNVAVNLWPLFLDDEVHLVYFREMSHLVDMVHGPNNNNIPKVLFQTSFEPHNNSRSAAANLELAEWCSAKLCGVKFRRMVTFEEQRGHVEREKGHGGGMGTRGL